MIVTVPVITDGTKESALLDIIVILQKKIWERLNELQIYSREAMGSRGSIERVYVDPTSSSGNFNKRKGR